MAHALARDLQRASREAGGPMQLWAASPAQLARWLRGGPDVVERATAARIGFRAPEVRDALARAGVTHIALGAPGYPERLARIFDPPFGLFGTGTVVPALTRAAQGPTIAIVGSRRPSGAGRRFAHDLAAGLAERGAIVVSGLARGIDTAAHEGALAGGGVTIGVLGSSVDQMHPRRNVALAERMMATGAVLSEYWPGTTPAPWRFPARNRIVAGLADAVVVVEAAARSGALITADFAMEHGTPVLAVPGWPGAEMSAGCNALLRTGAALCECVDDVVNEVPHAPWAQSSMAPARDASSDAVLRVVAREACGADAIAAAVGMDAAAVAMALVALEIDGAVCREPGGVFRAVARRRRG
jgi:DNA processing protein